MGFFPFSNYDEDEKKYKYMLTYKFEGETSDVMLCDTHGEAVSMAEIFNACYMDLPDSEKPYQIERREV